MRPLDVINLGAEPARPAPVMPSACESGGCGGPEERGPSLPEPDSFGEVSVNGVVLEGPGIPLVDDGVRHEVLVRPKGSARHA